MKKGEPYLRPTSVNPRPILEDWLIILRTLRILIARFIINQIKNIKSKVIYGMVVSIKKATLFKRSNHNKVQDLKAQLCGKSTLRMTKQLYLLGPISYKPGSKLLRLI